MHAGYEMINRNDLHRTSSRKPVDYGKFKGFLVLNGQEVHFYDVTTKYLTHLQDLKFDHTDGSALIFDNKIFVISGSKIPSVKWVKLNDLASGWNEEASTSHRRRRASSVVCDDFIYTTGGLWPAAATGERYGHANAKWNHIKNMNKGRWGHTLCALEGRVYAIGGRTSFGHLNDVECYYPALDMWMTGTPMNTRRSGLSSVVLNNEIYAIGGRGSFRDHASVERFNLEKGVWDEIPPLLQPRSWHGSCVINGKIYVAGGLGGPNTIEVYDPDTRAWTVDGVFDDLINARSIIAV